MQARCRTPNSELVRKTIDLNYANKQRASSLRWIFVNAALLAVFAYDLLWSKCAGYTSALHVCEAAAALLLAASLATHARVLAPRRARPAPLTPRQRSLLGLDRTDLDSSFQLKEEEEEAQSASRGAEQRAEELPASLSPPRAWPRAPPASPAAPASRASPAPRLADDDLICSPRALAAYLRRAEAREAGAAAAAWPYAVPTPPRAHQLAALPAAPPAAPAPDDPDAAAAGAHAYRRLQIDPQRLTEYSLNLRRWLHVSVFARLARELDEAEAALGAAGLGWEAAGAAPRLLPYLAPWPDRAYTARRLRELARGGCLSAYRWAGGGAGWAQGAGRPADAELVLHALAAYLDAVTPAPGFSAAHLAGGGGPGALVIRRASPRPPPHYVLLAGEEAWDAGAGRDNLLHTLLLFVAAAARRDPPAVARTHLGPAGLNLLWVIGR